MASTPFGVPSWEKSPSSGTGNCVEVAFLECDEVLVRDSKSPQGPVLRFNHAEWSAFLDGVRNGQFDPREQRPG